ncbi:MAG: AraC family transcriptional regulator [Acidobacteria bacterium]|nr:AraC family transcriptional regulator [Acidobacteriota bacterium]
MVLPNGAIELIFNFDNPHKLLNKHNHAKFELFRSCWIAGLQESPLLIEPTGQTNLLGIRFRPGGATPFLRLPVFELSNRVIECEQVFGGWITELHERLFFAKRDRDKVRLVETGLMQQLDRERIDPLVEFVLPKLHSADSRRTVAELSRSSGFSNKHFITRFKKSVGTTPKLLARILRFQSVIHLVKDRAQVNWAEVAQRCGYYDQAHMIKDFQSFSTSTPTDYLKHRDANENHMIVN